MSLLVALLLSFITSNTNEASATLTPFLHPPKLHPPPVHILAVLAQGMSVGVNTELKKNTVGPQSPEERVPDRQRMGRRMRERHIQRWKCDGGGEMRCAE